MSLDWLFAEKHPSYRICQKAKGMYYVEKFNSSSKTWHSACFESYMLVDCERFVEQKLNNDQDKVIKIYE